MRIDAADVGTSNRAVFNALDMSGREMKKSKNAWGDACADADSVHQEAAPLVMPGDTLLNADGIESRLEIVTEIEQDESCEFDESSDRQVDGGSTAPSSTSPSASLLASNFLDGLT